MTNIIKFLKDVFNQKPEKQGYEWLTELVIPQNLSKDDYIYPGDRKMLATFKIIPGAGGLAKQYLKLLTSFNLADLLGSSVQVTEKQFPELHNLVVRISYILGIAPPKTFLQESAELNAGTFGPDEKNVYIILTRGLVQASHPRELAYVIGHEMGHIKAEHVLYHTIAAEISAYLQNKGYSVISQLPIPYADKIANTLTKPAQLALLAWARRSEITADRLGLIACQDLNSAQRALALIALGSRELADQIDIKELEKQKTKGIGRWSELSLDHPYLPKRLKAIRIFALSRLYMCKIKHNKDAMISQDRANYYVKKVLDGKDADDDLDFILRQYPREN
jgi:Zn-dependent protease with chaperone function